MTEEHKKVVKNVLKCCIDDGKTKIKTSLIRDKLNENGMKAIAITAGRVPCHYAIQNGAQSLKYSTWDLGKFGVYDIIMAQYVSDLHRLKCSH
eukprot:340981_1